jgi:uncharacterized protein YndB with AHSA1/START domain
MATISRTRTVTAPAERVWEVLADFGAISSWAPNVDHSCLLEHGEDTAEIGTTRRVQVGRNALVERIVTSCPPTLLAYDIEGLPKRLRRVVNQWRLEPAGAGTEVTLATTVEIAANPIAHIAERALCRFMASQSDTMLAGLAQRVEDTRA